MTTIVANLECMAADQRVTSSSPVCHVQKIHRIGNSLFGIAGDVVLALAVIRWLGTKRDVAHLYKIIPEASRNDIDILELSKTGLSVWNGWGVQVPLLDPVYAVGSGAMSAMQAMKRGLIPANAVDETYSLDECSGGTVQVEWLLPPELTKRKRA